MSLMWPMLPRSPLSRSFGVCLAVLGFVLSLTSPAGAQRPSLIDLQAAIDGLVSPAPTPASGRIRFDDLGATGRLEFAVVELSFGVDGDVICPPGSGTSCSSNPGFTSVRVTVLESAAIASLNGRLAVGTQQRVDLFLPGVPDPKSETVLVTFGQSVIEKIDATSLPGRVVIEFEYAMVELEAFAQNVGWDRSLDLEIGNGCPSIPNQTHVDLAGNPATQLGAGEIESTHQLSISGGAAQVPSISVSYSRTPVDGCYFLAALRSDFFDTVFERLWAQDDQFGNRQSVETIDIQHVYVFDWRLEFANSEFTEHGDLYLNLAPLRTSGTQTLREFDPATGAETSSGVFGF
jgi:hypothetical protein